MRLRDQMDERGIDLYVVPNSDFHGSEYIGEHFKAAQYLTGFTGSAATVVVTKSEASLFTDGRYFIQADRQLAGSGVILRRMGEKGVPTAEEYVKEKLPEGGCIGFDGRLVSAKTGEAYRKIAAEKGGKIFTGEDLVGQIWESRPSMAARPCFLLEERYSGKSAKDKLASVREEIKKAGADAHMLSSLCDIAWLLNVRGSDIAHVPVVMSYLFVSMTECVWFVSKDAVSDGQKAKLNEAGVSILPYDMVYEYASKLSGISLLYDPEALSDRMVENLSGSVVKIAGENPTERMKAVKNPVEIENTKLAHIKDGVAVTKFIYWLKTHIGKERITECMASEYLENLRKEQEHFLDSSFETICAYGANAAMMHYQATPESHAVLKPEGFLLVDSGGHYLEGTTDITRTIALGPLSDAMRCHFTAVLRGCLNLAAARFLHGCAGMSLDILAREPLWNMGLDYKCGTGHGVGHILNVHEGPNAFRFKQPANGKRAAVLEEGMITTDEPGVYLENEYGIRIENELLCRKAEQNEYGQFLRFETITYAPVDLDAVCAEDMTRRERDLLNAYHATVYEKLSPYMNEEEKLWLKEYTRAI